MFISPFPRAPRSCCLVRSHLNVVMTSFPTSKRPTCVDASVKLSFLFVVSEDIKLIEISRRGCWCRPTVVNFKHVHTFRSMSGTTRVTGNVGDYLLESVISTVTDFTKHRVCVRTDPKPVLLKVESGVLHCSRRSGVTL